MAGRRATAKLKKRAIHPWSNRRSVVSSSARGGEGQASRAALDAFFARRREEWKREAISLHTCAEEQVA